MFACFFADIGHHCSEGVLLASSTFKQCWTVRPPKHGKHGNKMDQHDPTCTLPETNSLHLKMDGWKTSLSFWEFAYFQGELKLVFGRAISCKSFKIWTSKSTCLPSSSLMMSLPPATVTLWESQRFDTRLTGNSVDDLICNLIPQQKHLYDENSCSRPSKRNVKVIFARPFFSTTMHDNSISQLQTSIILPCSS